MRARLLRAFRSSSTLQIFSAFRRNRSRCMYVLFWIQNFQYFAGYSGILRRVRHRLFSFAVPFILVSLAWKDVDESNKTWFIFGVSFVLGCVSSYFVYSMRNLGLFIAGSCLGTVIGMEVYLLGLYKFEKSDSSVGIK